MPDNPKVANNQMFVTWANEKDKTAKLNDLFAYNSEEGFFRRKATASRNMGLYRDVDTNVNVRPGFTRSNYEFFRPDECTPKRRKEIITLCGVAAEKVGLIYTVIGLMGDFASDGVRIVHKDPKAQKVAQAWASRVKLSERCERFLNLLYSLGTVGILRQTATLNRIDLKKIQDLIDPDNVNSDASRPVNDIPIDYTFLHPNTLEIVGGDLALFGNTRPKYGVTIPKEYSQIINNPKSIEEKQIVGDLPPEIIDAAKSNKTIPLGENFSINFYKKNDWEAFPKPMIYPIIDDVMMLEKLKLTDLTACDSAISSVRLWRLGSLEHKILPTPAAVNKLSEILTNNVGGGGYDLIWDETLDFKESESKLSSILGEEKYIPTLNRIYEGLGVPPTLTAAGSAGGFTNNYISLKTLTKRLSYGRNILLLFLNQELAILQKALGLKEAFQVVFDKMTLSDEEAEKRLLIELLDRNVISDETVLDRFGEYVDIERTRVKEENKQKDGKEMPYKTSPYHMPLKDHELTKMFVQSGQVTPSQVGIELKEKKSGEKTPLEIKSANDAKKAKGLPGKGRPVGKKDSKGRKKKSVKVRTSAEFVDVSLWAKEAQASISQTLMPYLLQYYGKSTARALTDKELIESEKIKFEILSQLSPFSEIKEDVVIAAIPNGGNQDVLVVYNNLLSNYMQKSEKEPTIDYIRQLQVFAYSIFHQGEDDNG